MMRDLRLVIGIPSGTDWKADFGMSLAGLVADFSSPIPGASSQMLRVHNVKGSILSRSRQKLISDAIKGKATHVLFIDSDMIFPSTLFRELFRHMKPVVAANCATKMLPSSPTARLRGDKLAGVPLYTDEDSTGLVEVWRVGTGVMLIDLEIFANLPGPWFDIRWEEQLNDYVGEDWTFCEKLEKAKIPIYVDQDVSKEIGHIGALTYRHAFVGELVREICG